MASSHPRLVVTNHSIDGTSIFTSDKQVEPFSPFGPQGGSFAVFDARSALPVNNLEQPQDLSNNLPHCAPGGVMFLSLNLPPGSTSPMHRTLTLDYGIVLSGEIVLEVDGGEKKTIKAGEFIIQGGVNHKWINETAKDCEIVFVMVGAEKVKLESGVELPETV